MRTPQAVLLLLGFSALLTACDPTEKTGEGAGDTCGAADDGGVDGADGADGTDGTDGADGGVTDADADGSPADVDCDDSDPNINPEADELCDGVDNDCDGLVDSDDDSTVDLRTVWVDGDGDGVGLDGTELSACPGDGYAELGGDCDDGDANVAPGADELCDGVDNDCDLLVDDADDGVMGDVEAYADADLDTYGDDGSMRMVCALAAGWAERGGDCDDADDFVYPGAPERCDEVDADCDGDLDDPDSFGKFTYYADADLDGYGDAAVTAAACFAPAGFVESGDDCDDTDLAINPGATDVCDDGIDNNCNALVDCLDSDCAGDGSCPFACADTVLAGSTGSALASGTTVSGTPSEFSNACASGSASAPDVAFYWTAPADGCYTIDTIGSSFDTTLGIYSDCAGTRVTCNDDALGTTRSSITGSVEAGTELLLVVDGYSSSSVGAWTLNISSTGFAACEEVDCTDGLDDDGNGDVDCDDANCATAPNCYESDCSDGVDQDGDGLLDCDDDDCSADDYCFTYCAEGDLGTATGEGLDTAATAGAGDFTPSTGSTCTGGSTAGEDVQFAWEAPYEGCFTFTTEGSDFDTILRVYDTCIGEELDCNDDYDAFESLYYSAVEEVALATGDSLILSVDGYSAFESGTATVNIYDLTVIADATLTGTTWSATFDSALHGDTSDFAPSCADPGIADYILEYTAPATGTYTFDTIGSAFDTTLAVLSTDTCSAELGCDDDSAGGGLSTIDVELTSGETYYLRVAGYEGDETGTVVVNVTEGETTCADVDLGSAPAGVLSTGTTVGATADYSYTSGCGSSITSAPDLSFEWVAPETGCWSFDTFGSSFDTVLRVWTGCGGGLIACDDDTYSATTGSYVTSQVDGQSARAGDDFLLIVDGYSSSGNYILNASMTLPGLTCAGAEAACDDGLDNDTDGLIDCADSSCAGLDGCP